MRTNKKRLLSDGLHVRPFIFITILIVIAAWYVSGNWFQLMLITGESMSPAYHSGQFVIIDRHDRSFREGDVVAFRCKGLKAVLVKRIAACPGDTAVIENGSLRINGKESAVYGALCFENAGILEEEQKLGSGMYAVLGDNIVKSRDSRDEQVGMVPEEEILGRVLPQVRLRQSEAAIARVVDE